MKSTLGGAASPPDSCFNNRLLFRTPRAEKHADAAEQERHRAGLGMTSRWPVPAKYSSFLKVAGLRVRHSAERLRRGAEDESANKIVHAAALEIERNRHRDTGEFPRA